MGEFRFRKIFEISRFAIRLTNPARRGGASHTAYVTSRPPAESEVEQPSLVKGMPEVIVEVDPQVHLCADGGST